MLSAFCCGLQNIVGTKASHGKGLEIPDALTLLETLDLTDKVVTGDAIFCQHNITDLIVTKNGDYVFPVKHNQKNLFENIETAFKQPVFPPQNIRQRRRQSAPRVVARGRLRIEQRILDVLPVEAADLADTWTTVQ